MTTLIPNGYRKIAISEDRVAQTTIYFHPELKKFFCVVYDIVEDVEFPCGPFKRGMLPMFMNAWNDAFDMRGRYTYLDEN